MNLKDKYYVYFNLVSEINNWESFRNDMLLLYPNIIHTTISGTYVNLYFISQLECDEIKNEKTMEIYNKYVKQYKPHLVF